MIITSYNTSPFEIQGCHILNSLCLIERYEKRLTVHAKKYSKRRIDVSCLLAGGELLIECCIFEDRTEIFAKVFKAFSAKSVGQGQFASTIEFDPEQQSAQFYRTFKAILDETHKILTKDIYGDIEMPVQ